MSIRCLLVAAALASLEPTHADGLRPIDAMSIEIGDVSGVAYYTVERDGYLDTFEQIGGVVLANACGPCIGQWSRHTDDPTRKNSIITSFNRNIWSRYSSRVFCAS